MMGSLGSDGFNIPCMVVVGSLGSGAIAPISYPLAQAEALRDKLFGRDRAFALSRAGSCSSLPYRQLAMPKPPPKVIAAAEVQRQPDDRKSRDHDDPLTPLDKKSSRCDGSVKGSRVGDGGGSEHSTAKCHRNEKSRDQEPARFKIGNANMWVAAENDLDKIFFPNSILPLKLSLVRTDAFVR